MIGRPPRYPLFPYPPLFRSGAPGAVANGTASAAVASPSASRPSRSATARAEADVSPAPAVTLSSAVVATTALPRKGTGATKAASASAAAAASRYEAPGPSLPVRYQQARAAEVRGHALPQTVVVGLAGLGAGQRLVQATPVGEQRAQAVSQGPFGIRRKEVRQSLAHRGRSFQGTSLSTRGSLGRPSTRSAMMLRRVSEVPPSIELPRARR